jgi:hypothetical protein
MDVISKDWVPALRGNDEECGKSVGMTAVTEGPRAFNRSPPEPSDPILIKST